MDVELSWQTFACTVIFCVIWTTGGSSLSSGSPPRQEKNRWIPL